jgi:hypothetical protein
MSSKSITLTFSSICKWWYSIDIMTVFDEGGFNTLDSDGFSDSAEENRTIYRRAFDRLKDAKLTVAGTVGIVAVNMMCGDSNLVVHSGDSIAKQMEMAIPSAFGSPEATGFKVLDFGGVTAFTAASLEATRRTTSVPELGAIAISAQVVSAGTDALADQVGLVQNTLDVGSSSIAVAWGTKFFLDHIASAEDETTRRRWKMGAAAFAGTLTFGAWAFLGGDDGKLDLISHTSALAVSAIAYRFGSWRRDHKQELNI